MASSVWCHALPGLTRCAGCRAKSTTSSDVNTWLTQLDDTGGTMLVILVLEPEYGAAMPLPYSPS